ncbi:M15 family metallopeptidase [Bifidobacterium samirii]|uniref:D-alanyl-D-alanine carboxypeptidase n=1 Tax=Bifidobacterium samirii TaxID=2306974 RepID=A0A430FTV5_9BIFI|nr:M15 family metallopeptidase [Bifidobacterium samirii]RSX56269.1 D-alanyl-D-alanine carboxypeptidase [Bifidobacterium samirii]
MTTGNFDDYRRERTVRSSWRAARILLAVLTVLALAGAGGLFALGRIADIGPFSTGTPQADYRPDQWEAIVVNRWNRIPDDYPEPALTDLDGGIRVDERIAPDLNRMLDAMRAAGLDPTVTAGYRTRADQERIVRDRTFLNENQGMEEEQALQAAERAVGAPGMNEHELGLAVDVTARGTDAQARQGVAEWLAAHAWEHGFTQRYPHGREQLTGMDESPRHYRYVGADLAARLHDDGLVLEELERTA